MSKKIKSAIEIVPYFDGKKRAKIFATVYYRENKKKYNRVHLPKHPRASKNGLVDLHIVVAEYILNRYLKHGEVVHHKDHNRHNNKIENIMIFDSTTSHSAFHDGYNMIELPDGTYTTDFKPLDYIVDNKSFSNRLYKCPQCGEYKIADKHAKVCKSCALLNSRKPIPSKELLLNVVSKNITIKYTKVAKFFGVSNKTVKRWLVHYNINI